MEQTEIAQLLVTMVADNTKLVKSFEKANSDISSRLDKIIVRANKFEGDLSTALGRAGTNAARRLTGALAAGVSFAAIERFVSHVSESVENIQKQSRALGLSTDAFQELSLSAAHAGIAQETLNKGLEHFAAQLGEAQLHATPFGKLMAKLGVDVKAGTLPAFYQLIDALQNVGNSSQRSAVVAQAFGTRLAELKALTDQGAAALREQAIQFKTNGEIIQTEALDKLEKLKGAWIDLKAQFTSAGANVISGFADNFNKIVGGVDSPQFQESMKNFGKALADAADAAIRLSNSGWFKYIAAGAVGAKLGGPGGAVLAVAGTALYSNRETPLPMGGKKTALDDVQDEINKIDAQLQNRSFVDVMNDDLLGRKNPSLIALRARRAMLVLHQKTLQQSMSDLAGAKVDETPAPKIDMDLTGTLDPKKPSAYAKAKEDLKNKTLELGKAEDGSAIATAKAEAATALLNAAQSDGRKNTPALRKEIDGLAESYSKVVAARAFAKDMQTDREEIQKLADEAKRATLSVAALAAAEERDKGLAQFHHDYGADADINAPRYASQKAVIEGNAAAFGANTGAAQFAKDLSAAQDENAALGEQIQTVGLYSGALAEAQMRLSLLTKAMKDGHQPTAAEMAAIEADAEAHGLLTKQLEDEQKVEQNRVAVTDELRTGLENMSATGLTGFKDLRSAASSFLQELAQMILKLYVLEPLLNSLLGKQGTSGGGILGSLLGNILGSGGAVGTDAGATASFMTDNLSLFAGFADGGVMTSRGRVPLRKYDGGGIASSPQLAMFGEGSGPEAFVPLKGGAIPVRLQSPRIPSPGRAAGNLTIAPSFHIDARYATESTAQMLDRWSRTAAPAIIAESVRQAKREFPENLRVTMRDRG